MRTGMLIYDDPSQISDLLLFGGGTSLGNQVETSSWRQRSSPMLEVLIAGLLGMGTGSLSVPLKPQTTPSGSQISVSTGPRPRHAGNVEDISAPGRISEIRSRLSLNLKQVADAMQVRRPAVYAWLQGANPREAQQTRLKELRDIAKTWSSLTDKPVGKYLIAPLAGGASLLELLRAPELNRAAINQAMEEISSNIRAADSRKRNSGYVSAAKILKQSGAKLVSKELRRERINDAADFG
jgi:hypothetical protein